VSGSRTRRFERIYTSHYDAVLRYCLRRTDQEQALDAAAETFTVAWRRRNDMPEDGPLPWLYGVARKVIANQRRSRDRQYRVASRLRAVDQTAWSDPEPQVVRSEEEREVLAALDRLRPAEQEIIRLAGWEDLTRDEVGMAVGCSPNAATKRLNRALDHLARELGTERSRGARFFSREGRSA
jgi:RNA polymerase sigma-70 factor (ECF subfamily)